MLSASHLDLAIIGSGPAGLAAAVKARQLGIKDLVVFERDQRPGGILPQCIHNGFGLEKFKEALTGPEYANRYIKMTVAVESCSIKRLPVRTREAIPKDLLFSAMGAISAVRIKPPIKIGAVILADVCGTGVDVVATDDL